METIISPVAQISYDKQAKFIELHWTASPTSFELAEALNKALEVVETHHITNWLGDVRHMGAISPDDQTWINHEWFPKLLAAGIRKMAVIVGDDIFNQMSVETIMSRVDSIGFTSQYFPDTAPASLWLKAA